MDEKGSVYFFTGLAGAGKTTVGGLFYRRLKERRPDAVLIDGDQCRTADEGRDVVICSIAMYSEIRDWNRENIENYREIYVKVTRETLYRRDQKKLYSSGARNVVGVDLPYDEPERPDIVIQNDGEETPEQIVERLEAFFGLK